MRWLVYICITLFATTAAEWAPYYVQLFTSGQLQVLGQLRDHWEPCTAPLYHGARGDVACKDQFRIPAQWVNEAAPSVQAQAGEEVGSALGLGVVLFTTQAVCERTGAVTPVYGQIASAGSTLSSLIEYQTVPLNEISCSSDVLLRAWAPTAYRRHGHIDAPVVRGSLESVQSVKTIIEFMRKDFASIMAVIFMCLFLVSLVLERVVRYSREVSAFERFTWAWVAFMFCFSGLVNMFFPIISKTYIFTRASNFFALVAHCAPAFVLLANSGRSSVLFRSVGRWLTRPLSRRVPLLPIYLIFLAFVFTPVFAKAYAPIIIVFSCFYILFGIYDKSHRAAIFGTFFLMDGLKILMVPHPLSSFSASVFILLLIFDRVFLQFTQTVNMVSLIDWSHQKIVEGSKDLNVSDFLEELGSRFGIQQMTLCVPLEGGQFELILHKRGERGWERSRFLNAFPSPIFSHVLTTQDPLWHVEEDSLLALNLRKGEQPRQKYRTGFFCVLPLLKDSLPAGALGMTHYPSELAKDPHLSVQFETALKLLTPQVAEKLQKNTLVAGALWRERVDEVSAEILRLGSVSENIMQDAAKLLAQTLGVGCFLGRLDPISRRIEIQGISYASTSVMEKYLQAKFFAVTHNEQGPMPLAVNHQKCVTVPNTDWILEVLHSSTIAIFKENKTKSCAAIPIYSQRSEADTAASVWGVCFMESPEAAFFTARHTDGLEQLGQAIGTLLKQNELIASQNQTRKVLQEFLPANIVEKLVAGKSVREEELGYLLMADLKDSTRISRAIGAERWNRWVHGLSHEVEKLAERFGFKLQAVVWDAFYLTCAAPSEDAAVLRRSMQLAKELNTVFVEHGLSEFPDLVSLEDVVRSRFCLIHGDVTRDVTGILNSQWTIVGTGMAAVSKLEQACKGARGWFFVGTSNESGTYSGDWDVLEKRVAGTDEKILRSLETLKLTRVVKNITSEKRAA